MEKLEKGFKKKWLEALRSGKYKQCNGTLCYDGRYCCLGVAGKVAGMRDSTLQLNDSFDADVKQDGRSWWIGSLKNMKRKIPNILHGDGDSDVVVSTLIDMNDTGKSFSEIADYIEENL